MQRSNRARGRNAKTMALLAAATGLIGFVQGASAQTWTSGATGNWSNGANWTGGVPASNAATQLGFLASGVQTYTATNDIANPFTLAAMNFNNTGTGVITTAGGALNFSAPGNVISKAGNGGVTIANALTLNAPDLNAGYLGTITGAGGGTMTISGAIQSSQLANNNGGAMLGIDDPSLTVALSGGTGANGLYGIRAARGNLVVNGGTYTLTSTHRENDQLSGDAAMWAFGMGATAGTTSSYTQNGGWVSGGQGFFSVGDGSTTAVNLNNGAVMDFNFNDDATRGRFGFLGGGGTMNITGGSQLNCRLLELGRNSYESPYTVVFNVSGTGSHVNTAQFFLTRGSGIGTATISGGGVVDVSSTGSNGGGLLILGASAFGTAGDAAAGTHSLTVTGPGSAMHVVQPQVGDELGRGTISVQNGGVFTSSGNSFFGTAAALDPVNGGLGTLLVSGAGSSYSETGDVIVLGGGGGSTHGGTTFTRVDNGGHLNTLELTIAQDPQSTSTVIVDGANSQLNSTGAGVGSTDLVMGLSGGATGTLQVSNSATMNWPGSIFAAGIEDTDGETNATINVSTNGVMNVNQLTGGGAFTNTTGDLLPGGTANFNVSSGGKLNSTNAFLAEAPNSGTNVTVTGANSELKVDAGAGTSNFVIGDDTNSFGAVNVAAGGKITVVGNSFIAPAVGSTVNATVDGGSWTNSGQFQIAGAGTTNGGTAVVSVVNGGVLSANGGSTSLIAVFAPGTLNVGAGTTPATVLAGAGGMGVDGHVNYNSGTLNVAGTLEVGGTVFLSSRTGGNKKVLDVGAATLTPSGVVDLNDNDMIIRSNQKAQTTQFIRTARNGGLWNQAGITSTAAKNNPQHNTTLGVLLGSEYSGANGGTTTFNGRTISPTDTLVKYTYYGDTDFNGKVNFDDYVRTDNGFNNHLTGWLNGDFDGNGAVNFDDYVLIDLAFNTQSGTLGRVVDGLRAGPGEDRQIISTDMAMNAQEGQADTALRMVREHAARFGDDYTQALLTRAVPEPTTIGGLAVVAAAGLARRRRRH